MFFKTDTHGVMRPWRLARVQLSKEERAALALLLRQESIDALNGMMGHPPGLPGPHRFGQLFELVGPGTLRANWGARERLAAPSQRELRLVCLVRTSDGTMC